MACVGNDDDLRQVCTAPEGAFAGMQAGAIFVDHTTVSAAVTRELSALAGERGLGFVDAPVSGGAAKAREGAISIMASGPEQAFRRIQPALDAIAARVFRLGEEPGAGSRMKLINQLLAGVHIAAMAEAMVLAAKSGLDLATVQDVIAECAGNSWMFQNRGPQVVRGDYTPFSAVDIFVKDLAGGGVVPFLSFVVEKRMTRVVRDELHRFPDAARRY